MANEIPKGWQCPVCSRVMAPHVTSCERCVGCAPVYVPTPIWIGPHVYPWGQFWYQTGPAQWTDGAATTVTVGDIHAPASSGTVTMVQS